jgi:hypothetical protein
MVRGVVGGREFDLSQHDVTRRMSDVEPEPIREHFVLISEKPFPPKQALAQVTGWDRQTFTTMEAIRVLTRIGFVCQRRVDGRPVQVPADLDEEAEQSTRAADQRLSAVESAVAVMQEAIASLTRRIRELERTDRDQA